MSFNHIFSESDWDKPFFKVLSKNDTGSAPGHQGGLVIPTELRTFFPALSSIRASAEATTDRLIQAALYINGESVTTVQTRYQYQTWGGTRLPESRLTGNLGPILKVARGGDVLVMQRDMHELDVFRLWLVTSDSPDFARIQGWIQEENHGQRWGVLGSEIPLRQEDLQDAESFVKSSEEKELALFELDAATQDSHTTRIARSAAFRNRVLLVYGKVCAVCGKGFKTPHNKSEIEAAHIVPRRLRGADDVRNGLALCRSHHWAFDEGLFAIEEDRTVLIPEKTMAIDENIELSRLAGRLIREASPVECRAAEEALAWHRGNVLL